MSYQPTIYTPEEEERMVSEAYQNLLNGYLSSKHRKKVEIIERAYKFARAAHEGVRRRSGEPYILHPIAVATITSREIGLGSTSICAALLHDVVEDTDYTVEDIAVTFGDKIARIVEGLTKISGGIFGKDASVQAENFRKLLLTMSSDFRVILIKMADRLHNMRTLDSMPPAKQYKIAGETLYIYAPLAHRLGLYSIKTELEDLSFKYEHPDAYKAIGEQIQLSEQHRNDVFERFSAPIRERLDRLGLRYEFKVRIKSRYSIWKKMETKHIPFSEVYDLYAARIVFACSDPTAEKRTCWNIYSEITDLYKLHPDRTRDWLSTPKTNGYRALHITVMGPDGDWVEVQIRSERMNDIAEHGFAAHWKYKIGEGAEENELSEWLRAIEDVLKNPEPNALDFLDTIKLNLFAQEIKVFTPKGELLTFPVDATVIDMAFALHTEIGAHCIAGKVNHKLVPPTHKLSSGDQVEILTSGTQKPDPNWINYLKTAKGKTRLKTVLRHQRRNIIEKGETLLSDFLREHNVELTGDTLSRIINHERVPNKEELFYMVGNGEILLNEQIITSAKPKQKGFIRKLLQNPFSGNKDVQPAPQASDTATQGEKEKINTKKVYELKTIDGVSNYKLAQCCHPLPGDDVLGYVNEHNEVVVHKVDCQIANMLKASYGERLVVTLWQKGSSTFPASIHIEGIDRMGLLQEIIYIISTNLAINMRSLNIKSEDGLFRCDLDVLVADNTVLTKMCKRIKKVKGVTSADRSS